MKIITFFVLITILTGCGGKTLDCNDEKIELAIPRIISSLFQKARWGGREWVPGEIISNVSDAIIDNGDFNKIETLYDEEELDGYMCAGTFSFKYKGIEYSEKILYQLSYLEDTDDTGIYITGIQSIIAIPIVLAIADTKMGKRKKTHNVSFIAIPGGHQPISVTDAIGW